MRRVIRSVQRCNRPYIKRFSTQLPKPESPNPIISLTYIVGAGWMAYHQDENWTPDSSVAKDMAIIYGWPVVIVYRSICYVGKRILEC